jgi:CYTH domain-containing protein
VEIEKKYLIAHMPDLTGCKFSDIIQGYISYSPEIRVRKKGELFFLTKKSDGTITRVETETEINNVTFEILQAMLHGNLIEKTRYEIPLEDGNIAELDIYHSPLDGLTTVEVEFISEEQANTFLPPDWFGNDVTDDIRYKNKNLAQCNNACYADR